MKKLFLALLLLITPFLASSQCYNPDFDILHPGNGILCYQTGNNSFEVRFCPFNYNQYAIIGKNSSLTITPPGGIANTLEGIYSMTIPGVYEINNTQTNETYTLRFIEDYVEPIHTVEWLDENNTTMATLSYCKKEASLPLFIRINNYCIYDQTGKLFDLKINGEVVERNNYIEIKGGYAYLITNNLKNGDKLQLVIKDLFDINAACPICISPFVNMETQEVTLQLIDNETLPTPTIANAPFCAGDTAVLMRESSLTDVYFVNLETQASQAKCSILNPITTRLISKNKRSNGCYAVSDEVTVPAKDCGFKIIRGYIYEDLNSNYQYDSGIDRVFSNVKVGLNNGLDFAYTDSRGIYEFKSDKFTDGTTYRIFIADSDFQSNNRAGSFYSFPAIHYLDFSLNTYKLLNSDLSLQASSGRSRPGFTIPLYFNIYNQGKINNSGSLSITLDKAYTYSSASIEPKTISGQSLNFDLTTIPSGQSQTIVVFAKLSTTSALGDSLYNQASIASTEPDLNTKNNSYTLKSVVVGSFDPNEIAVEPKGKGDIGAITQTTELDYTIQFQNMGTDTAFTIVVKNKLPKGVDFSKFKMLSASHPYQLSLQGGDTIVWTFNDILLPDNKVNEPKSHGLIKYHIAQKAQNPFGTEIRNEAAIYFDYNLPVATNQVLNTVDNFMITGTNEAESLTEIAVYPNPSNGVLHVSPKTGGLLTITGNMGEVVYQKQLNPSENTNINTLSRGFYIYTFETSTGKKTEKLVVN